MSLAFRNRTARPKSLYAGIGVLFRSFSFEPDYLPVAPHEMEFALNFFVDAANRNVACRATTDSDFRQSTRDACDELFVILCGEPSTYSSVKRKRRDEEASLHGAFRVLCEHYEHSR